MAHQADFVTDAMLYDAESARFDSTPHDRFDACAPIAHAS
jgi:hypothetical protein